MLFEVLYLCPRFSHEEGPGPVPTDECLVGVVYITILLVHLQHVLQLAEPEKQERMRILQGINTTGLYITIRKLQLYQSVL